ncbi:protein DGS1, mitochondrial [Tanacetum coccineum]
MLFIPSVINGDNLNRAMLELNQILRANEINFAILAALPTFLLSLGVLMLLRARVKQDTRALCSSRS